MDDLVQDYSVSIANALEILPDFIKPVIWFMQDISLQINWNLPH